MNKKAEAGVGEIIGWIPRFFFLGAVIIVYVIFLYSFINLSLKISDVESAVFVNRLVYSRNGISYVDAGIDRVYPGIIDPARMDETLLNKSISYGENNTHMAANITLYDRYSKNKIKNTEYNSQKLQLFSELSNFLGAGSTTADTYTKYVLYKDNAQFKEGMLVIDVFIKNG